MGINKALSTETCTTRLCPGESRMAKTVTKYGAVSHVTDDWALVLYLHPATAAKQCLKWRLVILCIHHEKPSQNRARVLGGQPIYSEDGLMTVTHRKPQQLDELQGRMVENPGFFYWLTYCIVAEPDQQFHCDSCTCDLTHSVRIKCADPICEPGDGVDLCPTCFCAGKEFGQHKAGHAYRIVVCFFHDTHNTPSR